MHSLRLYTVAVVVFFAFAAVAVKGANASCPTEEGPGFDTGVGTLQVFPDDGWYIYTIDPPHRKTVFDNTREEIIKNIRANMASCKNRILEAIRDFPEAPDADNALTRIEQYIADFEYVVERPYYQGYQDNGALMYIREGVPYYCDSILRPLRPFSECIILA